MNKKVKVDKDTLLKIADFQKRVGINVPKEDVLFLMLKNCRQSK